MRHHAVDDTYALQPFRLQLQTTFSEERSVLTISEATEKPEFVYSSPVTVVQFANSASFLSLIRSQLPYLGAEYQRSGLPIRKFNLGLDRIVEDLAFVAPATFPMDQLGYFGAALIELSTHGRLQEFRDDRLELFMRYQLKSRVGDQAVLRLAAHLDTGLPELMQENLISAFSTTLADFLLADCTVATATVSEAINSPLVRKAFQSGLLKTAEDLDRILKSGPRATVTHQRL